MRQVGTNICQVLTPIFGLLVVVAMKEVGGSNLQYIGDLHIYVPIPQMFHLPYKPLSSLGKVFNVSECDQWYLYSFDHGASQESKDFFGYNTGSPIHRPQSSGMINGRTSVLQYPCEEVNKSVPYFVPLSEKYRHNNEYLFDTLDLMHMQDIDLVNKYAKVEHMEKLPDGTFTIYESTPKKLRYKFQANDNNYWQYHRNNGITKIGIINSEQDNSTIYLLRTVEGSFIISDMLNQAYIRSLFEDTIVQSGIQFMPFTPSYDEEMQRALNVIGMIVFPMCMVLSLPVFIYTIVLEKETKLLETMKINGMRMVNYWLVNFVFNFFIYSLTAFVYYGSGRYLFAIKFFTSTHAGTLIGLLFVWGLSQISLSFLVTVFLNESQTASIIGYALSIWACIIASSLNITVY